MTINEMLVNGGGVVLILLTVVQVTPIKINPWSWIANLIGEAINRKMMEKMEALEEKVDNLHTDVINLDQKITNINQDVGKLDAEVSSLRDKVECLDNEMCKSEKKCEERNIILCRARMLRFGDEILHGVNHSKEHFDQILLDCTTYEHYCRENKDFSNNITEQTINLINKTYKDCLEENSFL